MKNQFALIGLMLAIVWLSFGCKDDDDQILIPEHLTLQAIGVATGTPVTESLPGVGSEVTGNAFVMDFFDKETGERLGSVTDINVQAETFEDGSMQGENYTIFTFDDDSSTIVMHNIIDMTPVDSVTMNAIIATENTQYNVIGGTGKFADITGGSTLNATLDMSEFAVGTVGFDCTYGVNFN